MLRGYADATYLANKDGNTFGNARINPILLYKQSDKLFFEGEMEFEVEDGKVNINLEYADVSYFISTKMTLRAGKILLPFGMFFDRLHPTWINKLPTLPLGFGHDGILPTSDLGVEIRSGAYLGSMKFNYSLYVVNGPRIKDGSIEPEEIGMIMHMGTIDNNNNKAVGGRFGLFPIRNSSLEIGGSFQTGKLGNRGSELQNVSSQLYAFDWTYVKNLEFLKGVIDLKGQFNFVNIDNRPYVIDENGTPETFVFNNKSKTSFVQLAYRPSMSGSGLIRNFEIVSRYSSMGTPKASPWAQKMEQWAFGLNYWIDWRTALKIGYQIDSNQLTNTDTRTLNIQWTVGF